MKFRSLILYVILFLGGMQSAFAQRIYWQQAADYQIECKLNTDNHKFEGKESIQYTNNSPDTLHQLFFHLYFNAFQPESAMDVRSRWIVDPDGRVKDRISKLNALEYGIQKVKKLTCDGKKATLEEVGTILEVKLAKPVYPNSTAKIELEFEGQVPIQIRRSGRNNAEGVDYSMAQWYPKLCEYDFQGWHANPYIAREFYGIWGNFDVKLTLPVHQMVAATGVLQNPDAEKNIKNSDDLQTWHFVAKNVHDFVWVSDKEFKHLTHKTAFGTVLHAYYKPNEKTTPVWTVFLPIMEKAMEYANQHFGKYPHPLYSFIQGGDGGMEYPMATLITGERPLGSLVGVSVHEMLHSWYQCQLATNESLYPWMDEGFTDYAEVRIMDHLKRLKLLEGDGSDFPFEGNYASYFRLAASDREEALSTHADHFQTNYAYGVGSYVKGAIFLNQMEYIIGTKNFDIGLLRYFNNWSGKHPTVNDCVREFEKQSNLELDWYKEYWVNSIHKIDYRLKNVAFAERKETLIELERIGKMPMPVDIVVTLKDSSKRYFTIPLDLMRGSKSDDRKVEWETLPDWQWVNTKYSCKIPIRFKRIAKVEIDPSRRLADTNRENNTIDLIHNVDEETD